MRKSKTQNTHYPRMVKIIKTQQTLEVRNRVLRCN